MPKYKVYFKPSAEKELINLPKHIVESVVLKIDTLIFNPRPRISKKLKGEDSYRLRIGDYRIVYNIDDKNKTITVFRIRHRKDVYR